VMWRCGLHRGRSSATMGLFDVQSSYYITQQRYSSFAQQRSSSTLVAQQRQIGLKATHIESVSSERLSSIPRNNHKNKTTYQFIKAIPSHDWSWSWLFTFTKLKTPAPSFRACSKSIAANTRNTFRSEA